MPTLGELGFGRDLFAGNTLENLGAAAGVLPNSVFGFNAARRAAPTGPVTTGRMTWFNPYPYNFVDPNTGTSWLDTGAQRLREGAHASGLSIGTPGFATSGRGGLGHYYQVTLPDGRTYTAQKTDIGPPGVVDINAALASKAYPQGPGSVPGGAAKVQYIGATLPEGYDPADPQGWHTTVAPNQAGVGYVPPARVAQGATTNPADLQPQTTPSSWGDILADVARNFDFKPATPAKAAPLGFGAALPLRFAPVGTRR